MRLEAHAYPSGHVEDPLTGWRAPFTNVHELNDLLIQWNRRLASQAAPPQYPQQPLDQPAIGDTSTK
jgi:hypothetical protein